MKEHEKNKTTLQKQLKRIQIIALISFGIALIAIYLMTKEHMTVESILSGVGADSPRATFMLLLLFGIKSLSIVIPLPSLYLASGLFYHPVKAVAVSYLGLAITLSIPFSSGAGQGARASTMSWTATRRWKRSSPCRRKTNFSLILSCGSSAGFPAIY